jgi:hypothetical protein
METTPPNGHPRHHLHAVDAPSTPPPGAITARTIFEYSSTEAHFPPGANPNAQDVAVLCNQLALSGSWEVWRMEPRMKNTTGIIGADRHKKGTMILHLRRPITILTDEAGNINFPEYPGEAMLLAIEQMRSTTAAANKAKETN